MSITGIGTYANSQLVLSQIQKAENALDTADSQVATGNLATTYAGYGTQVAVMETARSAAAEATANAAVAQQASTQLSLQDTQMSELSDLANQVTTALTNAAANQDSTSLMSEMQGYFQQAVEILNSQSGGSYLYSGENSQTAPVTVSSLSQLANLSSVSDAFANGNVAMSVNIGTNQTVQVGMLASDIGSQLMSVFQQVAQYDQGSNGPLDGNNTASQQSFIESMIPEATDAATTINNEDASNGDNYQEVQNAVTQLQATATTYTSFVGNIQDADMSQAVTQLSNDQTALEAAYRVATTLNQMSLLNYLPAPTPTG